MNKAFEILTREYIESHVSDEEIFEKYFGQVKINHSFKNPLREDKTAGCRFNYFTGKLMFFDKAWKGSFPEKGCFTAWTYASVYLGKKGFSLIYQLCVDFNLLEGNRTIIKKKEFIQQEPVVKDIKVKKIPFTTEALNFWSCPNFEVTPEILEKHNIHQVSDVYYRDEWRFRNQEMTFAYFLEKPNIFQIYFPLETDRTIRFRMNRGTGIFGKPQLRKKENVILTKSVKDWFFLSICGFNTLFVLSECYIPPERCFDYVLFDNDETGIAKAKIIAERFNTKIINFTDVKDSADFAKKYGLNKLREYVNKALADN